MTLWGTAGVVQEAGRTPPRCLPGTVQTHLCLTGRQAPKASYSLVSAPLLLGSGIETAGCVAKRKEAGGNLGQGEGHDPSRETKGTADAEYSHCACLPLALRKQLSIVCCFCKVAENTTGREKSWILGPELAQLVV